jgi:hypothetical protein
MKVYVVSCTYGGCLKVFTSREKAEEYKEREEYTPHGILRPQEGDVIDED